MRLLLDQGVPLTAASVLRQVGFEAIHVGEIGLSKAADEEILARAYNEDRVVVTLDADFHTLLAFSHAPKPSVVRIRIEGLRSERFCSLLEKVVDECRDDLKAGALLSVQEHQIRIRKLPL
ncbi:MAG: DUF5615 family PIN-like protein [Chthoniobacteraceae bacterium]